MPRVFDCVILENEDQLDLLEARFTEMENIPEVTHVICEAAADHQGNLKAMYFLEERWGRFAAWNGTWNHVLVHADELPDAEPRERKNTLREHLAHGFNGEPEDIVMHGNIDEIPAMWMVSRLARGEAELPVTLMMRWCAFQADLVCPDQWPGTTVQAYQHISSFAGLRQRRKEFPLVITAGTRLTSMGEEQDGEQVLQRKELDGSWPRYVHEGLCPVSWLDQDVHEALPQLLQH